LHESPAAITIPLIVLAILSIIGGYIGVPEFMAEGAHKLNDFLAPIFAASHEHMEVHNVSHSTEWMLTGISTALILIVVVFAWRKFANKPDLQEATGVGKVLENKWYVDELYDKVIVKPLAKFGSFLNNFIERQVVDGIVNGVGKLGKYGSRQLRLLQSGQVGSYVLLMVLGMLIIFVVQFFLRKN
jgi:NADH-quinone oxidoreductase subunit L